MDAQRRCRDGGDTQCCIGKLLRQLLFGHCLVYGVSAPDLLRTERKGGKRGHDEHGMFPNATIRLHSLLLLLAWTNLHIIFVVAAISRYERLREIRRLRKYRAHTCTRQQRYCPPPPSFRLLLLSRLPAASAFPGSRVRCARVYMHFPDAHSPSRSTVAWSIECDAPS